ncbi:protein kinase domain-containing protein [Ideonella sp. YS5]|uniref:serine/threonine-protein kinase n=1 Tax=Ideonella sp. YS5 TaxID=3453714 RepID=UPI003EEEB05C
MSGRTFGRCQECFQYVVLDDICGRCGWSLPDKRRIKRALPLWSVVNNTYVVGRVLGSGGFGITYLAYHERLHRRVALKEYFPEGLMERASDEVSLVCEEAANQAPFERGMDRFFQEGEVLARFDRRDIVHVYDVLHANRTAYLAMEYLDGSTLLEKIRADGPMAVPQALQLITAVLVAVEALHEQNVVHRDLKPDNIYLASDGRVLLLDFGGAKQLDVDSERTIDGHYAGGYSAPEQEDRDLGEIGPWTDVYGVAATLHRMLTGLKLRSALLRMHDPRIDWGERPIPDPVRRAIEDALTPSYKDRYRSVRQFKSALLRQEAGPSKQAGAQPATRAKEAPAASSDRPATSNWSPALMPRLAAGGAAVVAVVAAVALLNWDQQTDSGRTRPSPELVPSVPPARPAPPAPSAPPAVPPRSPEALASQSRQLLEGMLLAAGRDRWTDVSATPAKIRRLADPEGAPNTSASVYVGQADKAIAQRAYERAERLLLQAVDKHPNDDQAWAALGYACLRLDKKKQARQHLWRALSLAADAGGTWATLGEALAASGETAQAGQAARLGVYFSANRGALIQHLKASPDVDPQFRAVVNALGDALSNVPARSP